MTREALQNVAAKVDENMAKAKQDPAPRYTMFGKSGTAQIPLGKAPPGKERPRGMGFYDRQYNSSFIAGAPVEEPRLVVLVVIDDPGPELRKKLQHYGSTTAGPAVRRIMERTLAYLGVPPSPMPDVATLKAPTSNAD
jgi:cell division protein FtsI/penicillin-binding protein 2